MTQSQSNLNRLEAQYELIMTSDLFNEADREQLRPQLEKRIHDARHKLETAIRNYEVQGAIEVTTGGKQKQQN